MTEIMTIAIIAALTGFILGLIVMKLISGAKSKTINAYKNKYEKMSVQSDSDESRIQALESKIQTLEIALENALNKS